MHSAKPLISQPRLSGKAIEIHQAVMRRISSVLMFSLLLLGAAQQGAGAQGNTQQGPAAEPPQATFRSAVEAVSVSASVRDSRGRVVRDLKQADFEVLDKGRTKSITDFWAGDAPISLGILLDISGSMAVGGNMERARQAVDLALANMRYGDEAALFTFDSRLEEVVPFTTELERVRKVSLAGRPWGMTSLYDAIAETARSAAERANRHRALLVITDGVDTGSKRTAPEVSGIAASIDVPVYLLTVVNPADHPGGEFAVIETGEASGTATLADLARWTGGDLRVSSVPAHTVEGLQDLFIELRHQYVITFEPGAAPGWHPLEIRTRKKSHVVRARSGYMAGPARVGS
jgi:Ca-activated chloride channel homolog